MKLWGEDVHAFDSTMHGIALPSFLSKYVLTTKKHWINARGFPAIRGGLQVEGQYYYSSPTGMV